MCAFIDPEDRPHIQCAKCRTAVLLPKEATANQKSEFAAACRHDSVQAIRFAEEVFSFGHREAKVLVLHVTREPGKCHRCSKLVQARESVCSCRSANLDW